MASGGATEFSFSLSSRKFISKNCKIPIIGIMYL